MMMKQMRIHDNDDTEEGGVGNSDCVGGDVTGGNLLYRAWG